MATKNSRPKLNPARVRARDRKAIAQSIRDRRRAAHEVLLGLVANAEAYHAHQIDKLDNAACWRHAETAGVVDLVHTMLRRHRWSRS